jgi:D-glycero-D-manno-heptose 1,7-bisphosphate phosphatase
MSRLPELVILDRDGVINEDSDDYIRSPEDWVPIPGSLEAIARLNHAGVIVVVASNQSGIGRGLFTLRDLNRIHAKFQRALARVGGHVDGIFFCPHPPDAGCECRKPAPGLLRSISLRFSLSLSDVPFIGDTKRDVEAALAARARPVLVRTGKGMRSLHEHPGLARYPWFDDLAAAVDHLFDNRPPI